MEHNRESRNRLVHVRNKVAKGIPWSKDSLFSKWHGNSYINIKKKEKQL